MPSPLGRATRSPAPDLLPRLKTKRDRAHYASRGICAGGPTRCISACLWPARRYHAHRLLSQRRSPLSMDVRIIDLDGSVLVQRKLQERYRAGCVAMRGWGPKIRLGCRFGRFRRFAADLNKRLAESRDSEAVDRAHPTIHFVGSGDFHHVTLALVRRLKERCNLLVLDNHPDWMRGLPFMHCGTWLKYAARLPQVRSIFHVGGDVDFDNRYRWLAPWPLLRSGKITVFPSVRTFRRSGWRDVAHEPVRPNPFTHAGPKRLGGLLHAFRAELARYPLYISLDKDGMVPEDATVNWDSGYLTLAEVQDVLRAFLDAAIHRLAGMDVVGDWSPVTTRGLFRRFLHWTEHPVLTIDPVAATRSNERTNLALLETVAECIDARVPVFTPRARSAA